MTWLTWRQHRSEALVVGLVLALLAALLIPTGLNMARVYHQLGVGECVPSPRHPNCDAILNAFANQFSGLGVRVSWLQLLPVLLAMLIGAPLVARELEHGTHQLAWTQSITRWRWLAVKVTCVLLGGLVASALLVALVTWWRGPIDQIIGHLRPTAFDVEGLAPLGYTAYALALAIAAGALVRRTIPAMAMTVAGFAATRLAVESFARPYYRPPILVTWDLLAQPPRANGPTDWLVDQGWIDAAGRHVSDQQVLGVCGTHGAPQGVLTQCIHTHGWLSFVIYQPANRFWLFQGIESAIFLGLAVALVALTIWWVRRRIA